MSLILSPRGCRLIGQYAPGAHLDLSSLGSMQVIVSHNPITGGVQLQYQSMVISQMSLQLAPSKYSDKSDSPWQLKEPWANRLHLNSQMNFKLSEYSLLKLSRT